MKTAYALAAVLLFATPHVVAPAFAADFFWNGTAAGDFQHYLFGGNWTPTGPPGAADRAIFDFAGSDLALFDDSATSIVHRAIEVRRGEMIFGGTIGVPRETYHLVNPPLGIAAIIGNQAGPQTTLFVRGVPIDAQGRLIVGLSPGSNGRLSIRDATWASAFDAIIGNSGSGQLSIEYTASMNSSEGILGQNSGSAGTAEIEGYWALSETLTVGQAGTALINLNGGQIVSSGDAFVAQLPGSSGALVFYPSPGASSLWSVGGDLHVGGGPGGAGGNGNVTVQSGEVIVGDDATVWPNGSIAIGNETWPGSLEVADQLSIQPGGELELVNGGLSIIANNFLPAPGTFTWTGGTLHFRSLFSIGTNIASGPLGPSVTVNSGSGLTVDDELRIGTSNSGQLIVSGGRVRSGPARIGSTISTSATALASISDGNSSWNVDGDLIIGGRNVTTPPQLTVANGADLDTQNAFVSPPNGVNPLRANIQLDGAGTSWHVEGSVYLGGDATTVGGTGTLSVTAGAEFSFNENLFIWDNYQVNVNGGTLRGANIVVHGSMAAGGFAASALMPSESLDVDRGEVQWPHPHLLQAPDMVTIRNAGLLNATLTGNGNTQVTLQGAGSAWDTSEPLHVGDMSTGLRMIRSLTMSPGSTVSVNGAMTISDVSRFSLGGGTINATTFDLGNQSFAAAGTINAAFFTTGDVTAAGILTLGDANSFTGVRIGGALNVGTHHVTLRKRGFFSLGSSVSVTGGTLAVPGGVVVPGGAGIVAFGTIDGRVAVQTGAVIEANGDLTLGDALSPAGFFSDGELVVGEHHVTLVDSNQAVLGSWTTLGASNGRGGTLAAANGMILDFGSNLTGHGLVSTTDDRALAVINNGSIAGESAARPIELNGYVKGVGTFDHVVFSGTFAPGLSPALVELGSAVYSPESTTLMELGGTLPGVLYDQLHHAGDATLGGKLIVELIYGFTPSAFQSFTLMNYATRAGEFDRLNLPPLPPGLAWTMNYGTTALVLAVNSTTNFLPGDIDLNGRVEATDASLFVQYLGRTESIWTTGDFNADGQTTLADLAILQSHLGQSAPSPNPTAAVPEPQTATLAAFATVLVIAIRRRDRSGIDANRES